MIENGMTKIAALKSLEKRKLNVHKYIVPKTKEELAEFMREYPNVFSKI